MKEKAKAKALRFLIYVPLGKEEEFKAYKRMIHDMGFKSINNRVWILINQDAERLFAMLKIIEGDKKE